MKYLFYHSALAGIQSFQQKVLLCLALLMLSSSLFAQIYEPEGLNMPGSWNSWTNPPTTNLAFASATQVNGGRVTKISTGTLRWQTTFKVAATGGDITAGSYEWVFSSGPANSPWDNKWGGVNVQLNTLQTCTKGNNVPNSSITLSDGRWYTMNWEDKGYVDTRAIFMETSSEPVSIPSVTQFPAQVSSGDAVTVTITTSAIPSAEEKIYVRYSNDNWSTSAVALATFSGATGTATIPVQDAGVTVSYYVMSTTMLQPAADHDLLTLRFNNNGGSNYSYTVTPPLCSLQVVSSSPAFPVEGQALTIHFNAVAGNKALQNYSGDVYIHTGVITNLSSSDADWKYTKTAWGVNTPETKLNRMYANNYTLDIADIRAYYGVPASETIEKLVMVFRSDGNTPAAPAYLVHKTADGADIQVQVYENTLQVKMLNPTGKISVVDEGMEIAACAAALNHNQLKLYVNNSLIAQTASENLSQLIDISVFANGSHWLIAEATSGSALVRDSVPFYIRGAVSVASLPEGTKAGINYINEQTVTLVLHDPPTLKSHVFVMGDFNGWMPSDGGYMNRTPDGTHYWITLSGLNPGQEYGYQYLIDGKLRLADPYCEKVLDPWNDAYISSTVYPGLKAYPAGETNGIVSVFETGQQDYHWQVTDFSPPPVQDMVIYELHVRDFTAAGTIAEARKKLDYLQSLGVNTIELMPINEFEGNDSWGYNPSFYFAADKAYGTAADYKQFIDECHQRGMAVILDMVLNHSFSQSPLVQMYFDASAGDYGQVTADNPWYNVSSPNPQWAWGYDFNHESIHTKNFIDRVNAYWLNEYNVDGFRFDFTKGFTNTPGSGWNYDAARVAILKRMADAVWAAKPGSQVILEHLTDNQEEKELADYGLLIWGNMSYQYAQSSMGYETDSDLSWGTHTARNFQFHNLISYMESHDEERMMYKNLTYGNSSQPAYDVKDMDIALARAGLAAAFYLVTPGPKMIWQFGELGYDFSINHCPDGSNSPECRTSRKPVPWEDPLNYYNIPQRKELFDLYAALIRLKTNFTVFRTGNFNYSLNSYLKRIHLNSDEMKVTLLGNFDVVSREIVPNFQNTGTWYEFFSGEVRNVTNTTQGIQLEPGEYRLYSTSPFYQDFYAAPTGDVSNLNTWGNQIDGSGSHPSSFTGDHTNYHLINRSNVQIASPWILGGTNSRLIVGNGVDAVHCTLDTQMEAENLRISPASGLTLNPGARLTVHSLLLNEAGASMFRLQSGAGGSASLIHQQPAVAATVQRYLTGGWGDNNSGWHQLSSPVAAQPIAAFASSGAGNDYDFYGWNEAGDMWMNYKDAGFQTWNGSLNFNVGQGYLVSYEAANTTKTFTGELNVADVTIENMSYGGSAHQGWHLRGNPYASALVWNDANWYLENVSGVAKIWNEAAKSYSDIPANGIIPSAQGFMVQVSSAVNRIIIPEAARIHSGTPFYKSGNAQLLLVAAETEGGSAQESKIMVNPMATEGFDFDYDSRFLPGYAPLFYSMAGDELLSTNSLPDLASGKVIPFGFVKNAASDFTIELKESIPGTLVYLTDKLSGTVTNLTETPVYSFTSAEGDDANRFALAFGSLGIDKPTDNEGVQVFAYGGMLYVQTSSVEPAVVNVYNLTGQLVMQSRTGSATLSTFNASALGRGVYVVNVILKDNVISRKVVNQY